MISEEMSWKLEITKKIGTNSKWTFPGASRESTREHLLLPNGYHVDCTLGVKQKLQRLLNATSSKTAAAFQQVYRGRVEHAEKKKADFAEQIQRCLTALR